MSNRSKSKTNNKTPRAHTACPHSFTRLTFRDGTTQQGLEIELELATNRPLLSARCDDCGKQLSLGESDETPARVAEGIRAAEMIAEIAADGSGESDIWADDETFTIAGGPWQEDFSIKLWPWDVTRPVAGQFREQVESAFRRRIAASAAARHAALDVELELIVGAEPEPGIELDIEVGEDEPASGHEICRGCKQEIDPETCHCGSAADAHGMGDGHSPVPMGCICHLTEDERNMEIDPDADALPSSLKHPVGDETITLGPPVDVDELLNVPLVTAGLTESQIDEMADDGTLGAVAKHLAIDAGADWPSLDGDAQDAWHETAIAGLKDGTVRP